MGRSPSNERAGNQFRALEEDEVNFLDSMITRMRDDEQKRKVEEGEDLDQYRRYQSQFPLI